MQTVFIGIGAVGLVLLLVSLIAGDLLDGLFDAVGSDLVSGLSVSGFLAAFGFTGALVLAAGAPSWAAILAGLVAGVAVAAAAGFASGFACGLTAWGWGTWGVGRGACLASAG